MTAALTSARRRAYYRLFGGDRALANVVRPGDTVLDVGCSDGRGSEVLTGAMGCDIHLPTLRGAASSGRRWPVVQSDVRRLPFRSRSCDVVAALDVVEHFVKDDALQVIHEMERVSRRTVVVMTPSGFVAQPPTETEAWQEHRSGFEADELTALGFEVKGIGGWARLRGDYGSFRGGLLGQIAAAASDTYIRRAPHRAFHLLAVKSTLDP
jgi:SAM-dependent methyltransferase